MFGVWGRYSAIHSCHFTELGVEGPQRGGKDSKVSFVCVFQVFKETVFCSQFLFIVPSFVNINVVFLQQKSGPGSVPFFNLKIMKPMGSIYFSSGKPEL